MRHTFAHSILVYRSLKDFTDSTYRTCHTRKDPMLAGLTVFRMLQTFNKPNGDEYVSLIAAPSRAIAKKIAEAGNKIWGEEFTLSIL